MWPIPYHKPNITAKLLPSFPDIFPNPHSIGTRHLNRTPPPL